MVVFFTFATLLMWPTMMFYARGSGYDSFDNLLGREKSMISNLGYSSTQCASIPVEVGKLSMTCPYGTIALEQGTSLDFGVNSALNDRSLCTTTESNEYCKPNSQALANDFLAAVGLDKTNLVIDKNNLYTGADAADKLATCVTNSDYPVFFI